MERTVGREGEREVRSSLKEVEDVDIHNEHARRESSGRWGG
jgi:hypothetical protein